MKKNWFLVALTAVALVFTQCDTVVDDTCDNYDAGTELCTNDFSAIATFCSDGINNSYYTYNGKDYECTGVEASTCDAALQSLAADLIAAGCETAKKSADVQTIKVKLTGFAEHLLEEVRTQSLTN